MLQDFPLTDLQFLIEQNKALIEQNKALVAENKQLRNENQALLKRLDLALNKIAQQEEEIAKLKEEIARLKGQKPRPKIPPSILEGPKSKRGPSSSMTRHQPDHCKTSACLIIHETIRVKAQNVPKEAVFKGFQSYTIQELILKPHNTRYELERWRLPDGQYLTARLPEKPVGHYGPKLVAYLLHQYYGCRVTEPLLLAQLKEIGIRISAGQLSHLLLSSCPSFHQEKDRLLPAGLFATRQIQADDTGARHAGRNGYSTVIGNRYFTSITSTCTKNRMNFLALLHGASPKYLVNQDVMEYLNRVYPNSTFKGPWMLMGYNRLMDEKQWQQFLRSFGIQSQQELKYLTEAALFASLIAHGVPKDLGVHSDDAGQFKVFAHSLCWIHEERHYRKLIACNEVFQQAIDEVRGEIWQLYQKLQAYKVAPSPTFKQDINRQFDALFLHYPTTMPSLKKQLLKTYAKKRGLLQVLERPDTPLHNNLMETDAREVVVKRKISGGTRSLAGKRARDTFLSLKKTCIKLGVNFFHFLEDRLRRLFHIPPLEVLIINQAKLAH